MQSVCALVPTEYFQQVVDVRASLCEDPLIGAIYDPPFVHFTLQLAEDYDWPGLEASLAHLAQSQQPFKMRTIGLLAFTGRGTGMAVAPYKDQQLAEFHAAVWEAVTPFAQGRVDDFYHPDRWVPHITVKRCGSDAQAFGGAMAKVAHQDFRWDTTTTTVAVQHDPGKNSLTHYQRLAFQLGGDGVSNRGSVTNVQRNATILGVQDALGSDGAPGHSVQIKHDDGQSLDLFWSASMGVRIMAEARSSTAHFGNARCLVDGQNVTNILPNSPFPTI